MIATFFPLAPEGTNLSVTLFKRFPLPLRIGLFMYKCYWHETLLHFGPQAYGTPNKRASPPAESIKVHLSNCYYHQDLHWRSIPQLVTQLKVHYRPHASSYFSLFQPALPTLHNERKVSVVDHNEYLSAIHFRDRFIRQVSCYTLLSGCRLPWPPSCCLYESTPFLGSLSILSLAP